MSSRPVSSPAAPAAGCSVAACMPGDRAQLALEVAQQLEPPLAERRGRGGVDVARARGIAATSSNAFGLYFIVHEPSGYAPRSTENWRCDSRVKWPTRSRSETSGSPTGASRRNAGSTSSRAVSRARRSCAAGTPRVPVTDSSKTVGSASRPMSGADARAAARARSSCRLGERRRERVDLGARPALGDGDDDACAPRRPAASDASPAPASADAGSRRGTLRRRASRARRRRRGRSRTANSRRNGAAIARATPCCAVSWSQQ